MFVRDAIDINDDSPPLTPLLHFILFSQKNLTLTAGRSPAKSEVQIFASLATNELQQIGAQVSETRSSNSSSSGCQCGQKYRQEKRLRTSQKVAEAIFRSGDCKCCSEMVACAGH
jgi:hypothetical protein